MCPASERGLPRFFFLFLLILLGNAPGIAPESPVDAPKTAPAASAPSGIASSPAKVSPENKRDLLAGTWSGGGCLYRIDSDGYLRIQRNGAPLDSIRGRYSWFRMGIHDCIAVQREGADSLSLQVLLIGEVSDTRAVIALGTPFLRTGKGKGLPGDWKHLEHLARTEWKLSPDTVEYRRIRVIPQTGEELLAEARTGTYREASGKYEEGSYEIAFRDGSRAVTLPIVYRDMMYLFDLTPGKSLFSRVRETYSDIQPEKSPDKNERTKGISDSGGKGTVNAQ